MKMNSGINKKRFQIGTLSTVITIAVIAVIIFVNVLLNLLVAKFPLKLDLTKEGVYNLSEETTNYVKKLDKDVEIIYLSEEGNVDALIKEPINNYPRLNAKIVVKFIDTNKNPAYFKERNITDIAEGTQIIVYSPENKRYKSIDSTGIVTQDQQTGEVNESVLEKSLTSAILYVTKKSVFTAYFIEGHGETYSTTLENTLVDNGYIVKKISLLKDNTFDDTAKLMFINAPTADISEDDVLKINKFLLNDEKLGRNLFVGVSSVTPETPILNSYLTKDWGVKIENSYVVESKDNMTMLGQYPVMLINYSDADLSKGINTSQVPLLTPLLTKPVTIVAATKGSVKTTALAETSKDSFLKPTNSVIDDKFLEKGASDVSGVFNVATLSTRLTYENETNKELTSSIVVAGTTSLEDEFLSIPNIGNIKYFLKVVQKVSGDEAEQVNILPKYIGAQPLNIENEATFIIIAVIIVLIIPILVLGTGLFIWLRRRHL